MASALRTRRGSLTPVRLVLTVVAAMAALTVVPTAALAHVAGAAAPGLPIPALSHGQMAVVAEHRRAILDLARTRAPGDQTVQRLLNHASIQHAYCLWGLMPGSLRDEASPFNACSHAALASALAVLDRLEAIPAAAGEAQSLRRTIDADMIAAGTASELCAYSGTGFSTGTIVRPAWAAVPSHPPTLATATATALAIGGGFLVRRRRR